LKLPRLRDNKDHPEKRVTTKAVEEAAEVAVVAEVATEVVMMVNAEVVIEVAMTEKAEVVTEEAAEEVMVPDIDPRLPLKV
jgi:hypothetical protein